MPPTQFLKQSKTKMQAWVTSNGLNGSQPAPTASASGPGHDTQGQSHLPQRHVLLQPPATLPIQTTQKTQTIQETTQNSPPRSRAPIVNANSNRAAAAAAARLPVPTGRTSHARDTSLNMSRARGVASEPIQSSSRRPAPFWEGSTVDGSLFSDSGSNPDANAAAASAYRFRVPTYQHQQRGDTPQPRPIVKDNVNIPDQYAPFTIGPNGLIDVVGGPLTRSASTPDARGHRIGLKGIVASPDPEPEPDQESEDSPYQSPEKTPSAKRLHHPKALTLRTNRRGSFSERAAYPQVENIVSSPARQPYQDPSNDLDEVRSENSIHLRVKTQHDPQRSTIFADTDTPMVSHHDESETESVIEPPPPPKPVTKPKLHLSRQLFAAGSSKARAGLSESAMPRPSADKRPFNSRKRQHETDYDDGALAAMDYAELKKEAFDFDPAQAEAQSAIGPPRGTLPEKLDMFFDKDQPSQTEFFSKMTINDWEASGDWFLERFGDVMHRLREARQMKRSVIEGFENEIAERGEAVRNKIQGIDYTLAELKSEGEGMMIGKEFD
ncbi:extracellular mutant protein 11-domain-containing protein [Annulohypoxylon maeteangense]|uniref:extracellular mutant protein 11-domain-containing protein n=1 Tax=Annulohypoxylon maeteangense TaxID=1927788 RepID=UPI0020080FA1|nr:extracellular mutant protein 11-domain-containing protein [Annulohypoxylon maeteangense]KAI0889026.1 extracellular mutant protein 11-domain-containing protein [Annulohypoxylon maeteangense]